MPYRLLSHATLGPEIGRVASEQIERAVGEIDDPSPGDAETLHQVRKRCKKLRGLLRLVRPGLGEHYARENARYRDIARDLAPLRDAGVLLATHDALAGGDLGPGGELGEPAAAVRRALAEAVVPDSGGGAREGLAEARERLCEGGAAVARWSAGLDLDALVGGLRKTYRRGRRAMARAYERGAGEDFHEWRKRVKYHLYHQRLLREAWPALTGARRDAADALADRLGVEHDLTVYIEALRSLGPCPAPEGTAELTRRALQARETRRREARPLGLRLYAVSPKCLAREMGALLAGD